MKFLTLLLLLAAGSFLVAGAPEKPAKPVKQKKAANPNRVHERPDIFFPLFVYRQGAKLPARYASLAPVMEWMLGAFDADVEKTGNPFWLEPRLSIGRLAYLPMPVPGCKVFTVYDITELALSPQNEIGRAHV